MPIWVTDVSNCKIQTVSGGLDKFCNLNDLIAELKWKGYTICFSSVLKLIFDVLPFISYNVHVFKMVCLDCMLSNYR